VHSGKEKKKKKKRKGKEKKNFLSLLWLKVEKKIILIWSIFCDVASQLPN
jgi:hypothetical protein